MPIDHKRLLDFAIPDVRQSLTRRDTAFYALSVGMGQDPEDEKQLRFVNTRRDLVALPSMAVVLAGPGFWLANPETGVDPTRVVHGEQSIALHRPLPVEGELVGRTRITGLVDKGAGKAALLYTEKLLTDAGGNLIATTTNTTFIRDGGGFGGPGGPTKLPHILPDRDPDHVADLATRPEQALYYRLNGDDNPLHADPAVARAAGFPRPILHGLATLGVVCHAIVRALADYQPERLTYMELRFSAPVFPGETIRAEMWSDGSFRARATERDIVVVDSGLALLG